MKVAVTSSEPVRTIMQRPYGKTRAEIVRIKPGASDWYQGDALVLTAVAQTKESSIPAITADMNILSILWWAL